MREPYFVRLFATELTRSLVEHPAQNRGECLVDGHNVGAEQERLLVNAPFGVGLETRRVEPCATLGITAHHERAVLAREHCGRHGARPVRFYDAR
ncbi:hypothetical protein [Amycolatopsis sulphurea]|uniref:hypothetical protein n=1 Tax=Amycolatopsis sulphurea TaxID=76022 RepID=UPI001B804C7F